jgi:Protein of unknown function (DUF1559)
MENDSVQSAGGPSLDLSRALNKPKSSRIYFLAKVLGGIAVALFLIGALNGFPVRNSREAARRTQCKNNLKQIGLALHSYHEVYGSFPPAYTVDSQGNRLDSWRTLILPFMDEQKLYESIDLTKPWDHLANAKARQTAIAGYTCPSAEKREANRTVYLAISTPDSCFPGSEPRKIRDITDGTFKTMMVAEVAAEDSVEWMQPQDQGDFLFKAQFTLEKQGSHYGRLQCLFGDGTVRAISSDIDPAEVSGLTTIAGGETIGED